MDMAPSRWAELLTFSLEAPSIDRTQRDEKTKSQWQYTEPSVSQYPRFRQPADDG
jgi:hypothetical protein